MKTISNHLFHYGSLYLLIIYIFFRRFKGTKAKLKKIIKKIKENLKSGFLKESEIDEIMNKANIEKLSIECASLSLKSECYAVLAFFSFISLIIALFSDESSFANTYVVTFTFILGVLESVDNKLASKKLIDEIEKETTLLSKSLTKKLENNIFELTNSSNNAFNYFVGEYSSNIGQKISITIDVDGYLSTYETYINIINKNCIDIGKANKPRYVTQKYYNNKQYEYSFEDSRNIFCINYKISGHTVKISIPFDNN